MIFFFKPTKSEELLQERKQTESGDRGIHLREKLLGKVEQFSGSPNPRSKEYKE